MSNLKQRLQKCLALALPEVAGEDIPRASVNSTPGWDSVATVNIMTLVEEEFGAQVSDDDLDEFVSFDSILGYLRTKFPGI